MKRTVRRPGMRRMLCLLAAILLLCLCACSDQIYDPSAGGDLTITPGGVPGGTNDFLELETEPVTGSVIQIPTTDPFENSPHVLRADFLRTGNSDVILLRMDDTVILVDTGETDDFATLRGVLMEHGIETVDYLIITHYDNDHIGTVSQLLQEFTVRTMYMPAYVRDSSLYRRMMSTLEVVGKDVAVHRLTEDVFLQLDYGRLWINPTALYEPEQTLGSDQSHALEENNYSLITSVEFGSVQLLLTGDAERDRMEEFSALPERANWSYDLVKTPHHGSYDKALGDFLRECKPRYCTICVGSESLVDASLVTSMRTAGSAAYYTYDGSIHFATDGTNMTMTQD